jgi:hypothetical protein
VKNFPVRSSSDGRRPESMVGTLFEVKDDAAYARE